MPDIVVMCRSIWFHVVSYVGSILAVSIGYDNIKVKIFAGQKTLHTQ